MTTNGDKAPANAAPITKRIDDWQRLVKALAAAKTLEMAARTALFAELVPDPREGANNVPLPDGRTFAATHNLNYKLDADALPAVEKALGKALAKKLIRRKPELAVGEYRLLDDAQRLILSDALTVTPGAPDIEIRVPKAKK